MKNDQSSDLAIRLQGIIDAAIDGIITISDRGIIETINNSALDLFGYDEDEVVGQNVKILMPQPYRREHDQYLERYNRTKEARIIGIGREVQGQKKNKEVFPFRLAVGEVILNDRVLYTGIIHDLSDVHIAREDLLSLNKDLEQKVEIRTIELEETINKLLQTNSTLQQRELELNEALSKEKELNELKSRFVSMASHEFRTPLSTILSSASLISKYTLTDQQENRSKHIGRIKSAVDNLTGILNDFLSLSKIEEGKVEIKIEEFSPVELCKEIDSEVGVILKEGQTIKYDSDFTDALVNTDRRILKNILFNLISNAIKYSEPGAEIKCKATLEGEYWKFSVIDQGIGIPEEEQKYLFQRFFRATNVENIQGTGLGLHIVKRYVSLLKGTLEFNSVFGKGTTFTFEIPKN